MRNILLFAAILSLTGCAWIDNVFNPNPNIIATMESTLAFADDGAVGYLVLDNCKVSPAPCRDTTITVEIDTARAAAYNAITAAEANETAGLVTAAQNALTIYENLVNALPAKTAAKGHNR